MQGRYVTIRGGGPRCAIRVTDSLGGEVGNEAGIRTSGGLGCVRGLDLNRFTGIIQFPAVSAKNASGGRHIVFGPKSSALRGIGRGIEIDQQDEFTYGQGDRP